jgi:Chaperone of endosialidase
MKHRNSLFTTTLLALCFLAFGCLVFPQKTHAVSPPPDGGYPGGNTAEGQSALLSRTTGIYNTAVGIYSLLSLTDGNFCTAVGAGTLLANTADENTATGAGALFSNTSGLGNTANGAFVLFNNISGLRNTANGFEALFTSTTGFANTANGAYALFANTADDNTAIGDSALRSNTMGHDNTAAGVSALTSNTTGSNNTALGTFAGSSLTTGDNNIDIGYNVVGVAGESNTIRIGDTDITDTFIRGISGATVASGATVLVASNGHLGTITSSKRFKEEIKPMDKGSEALFSLRPVTFRYTKEIDPTRTRQFGLVAEDVEKVNSDLVVRDENGKVNSVRYEQVNAMLLNEFLKEHNAFREEQRKVQEQEATIAELKSGMKALAATVSKQASQLQKVSVQVELNKPTPRTVANHP